MSLTVVALAAKRVAGWPWERDNARASLSVAISLILCAALGCSNKTYVMTYALSADDGGFSLNHDGPDLIANLGSSLDTDIAHSVW